MQVVYFTNKNNESPIRLFIDSLPIKQKAKIFRILLYIEKYGLSSILPHIRKIAGTPLWEIRILGKDNIRIIYVVPLVNIVLLLNGFIKKSNKTPKGEINIAIDRLKQWESSLDK